LVFTCIALIKAASITFTFSFKKKKELHEDNIKDICFYFILYI